MQVIPVASSLLRAAQYDEEAQELHLTFSNGSLWIYSSFSQEDADALAGAPSAGKWFLEQIKGQYPERRA